MVRGIVALGIVASALSHSTASADKHDLVLSRLSTTVGGNAIGLNQEFRSLASELGVVVAPRLSTPADTLGLGGFELSVDTTFTGISSDASYWHAMESSAGPTDANHGEKNLRTTGFFVRKGLWLPAPNSEVGFGAVHVENSSMWAVQGYVKLAIHEGFHDWPVPSVSLRAGASRLMGSADIDLTVASFDVTASKDFGLFGTVAVSPYVGWNRLWIIPRSEVLDATPQIDPLVDPDDATMNFAFVDQSNISRNRYFIGTVVRYAAFSLHLEAAIAKAGTSADDRSNDNPCTADIGTSECDSVDQSSRQNSITIGLGLDL